jgi:alpha-amylase/alpha-mannosidase (GH57 family)
MDRRYVCIHGHFYQPPRENPWLEWVELQDSAYPYHDWNERVTAECYAPNTAARILDPEGYIVAIVNNYARISFNFGPTLLYWMEAHRPDVYRAIQEADRIGQDRFSGHGPALAQAYNHMILPLAHPRDRRTQVLWGLRDFEHRFGRPPEGLWLPETAVDVGTLEILAEFGLRFTILAPHQARRVRRIGEPQWHDVSGGRIDPTMPYLCRLPSGRTIVLFFYDGPIARDVAFGDLLRSGEAFARRLLDAFPASDDRPRLVHIATDGETYGHHHRFGDMALAYALDFIEKHALARLTVYGEFLERFPPTHEVEIIENTSWSCAHGVERWRSDCGCRTGVHPEWTQAWRAPLRAAMDWLRDTLAPLYEQAMRAYVRDPWQARDDYIDVILDRSVDRVEAFLARHAVRELRRDEKVRVLKLLELQRNAMLMFTSCGWFFEDISGLETVQVLLYAARAIQLAEEALGVSLESDFLEYLERAPSNVPAFRNGARVYETLVRPARLDLLRVGAHYAIASLWEETSEAASALYSYTVERKAYDRRTAGRQTLAIGQIRLTSRVTWEEGLISFAALYLGDHHLNGGVRASMDEATFAAMHQEIGSAFDRGDLTGVLHLMEKYFGSHHYSLGHLFRDDQRRIVGRILQTTIEEVEQTLRQVYTDHRGLMEFLRSLRMPLPRVLAATATFVLNREIRSALEDPDRPWDDLEALIEEAHRWDVDLDRPTLRYLASRRLESIMEQVAARPGDPAPIEQAERALTLFRRLALDLDLWRVQNIYFTVARQVRPAVRERADRGDPQARRWLDGLDRLGEALRVRVR